MASSALTLPAPHIQNRWLLNGPRDFDMLFASAGLVVLVYLSYELGNQRTHVNMLVTLFIGGPHMFATYAWTVLEPGFKRRHRLLMPATLIAVPATVIALGLTWFDMLLTGFFMLASLHVAEQFSYLTSLYAPDLGAGLRRRVRLLDFSLILASLHSTSWCATSSSSAKRRWCFRRSCSRRRSGSSRSRGGWCWWRSSC